MLELDESFWEQLQSVYDAEEEALADIGLNPPTEAAAVTLLGSDPLLCGLCDNPIIPGDVYWVNIDNTTSTAPDDVAHPICWASESADAGDPYRFYGVRRSDF